MGAGGTECEPKSLRLVAASRAATMGSALTELWLCASWWCAE